MTITQGNGTDGSTRPGGTEAGDRRAGLWSALVRAGVLVLLFTLAVGYVAYKYSARQAPTYEATAEVVLSSSRIFSPIDSGFFGEENRYVQNQASIMTTLPVLERAAKALDDGVPATELRNDISTSPSSASDVITITTEAENADLAAARANAVAEAYGKFTAAQVQQVAESAIEASRTDPILVRDIRARAAVFGDGVSVIQPAEPPSSPASPTPGRNAYLAAAAAFLLAAGAALLWLGWRRPSGPERLSADAGAPLLGRVPVRWYGPVAVPQQPRPADYGIALQALRYRLREAGEPSVLLTALGRDTAATSALLGLARADAALGRRVVLVDATEDGRLVRRAGVQVPAFAAGKGSVDRALVAVPMLAGTDGGSVRVARVEPHAIAGSEALRRTLTSLLAAGDLVLIDAGAVVHDPTAFALLGEVGAVVAVARAKDRSGELRELRRRLALAGRECDGVLVAHRTWLPPLSAAPPATPAPAERPAAPRTLPPPSPAASRPEATEPSAARS